jgi:MFS family permease
MSTELDREHDERGQVPEPTRPAPVPLWRNVQFQTIWIGSAASTLGSAVASVAYPLAILAATGSPGRAGLFAAVQATGLLLAGLPAGQLADRFDPRRILIISETGRALVTAVIVVTLATGSLSFPLLIAAALLLGLGQPASSCARLLLVRAAVDPAQLTRALTQDEVRINGAALVGPPLAGVLFALRALAHAAPFVFVAGSFLVSVLSSALVRIRPDRPDQAASPAAPKRSPVSGMLTGVRVLLGDPVLRAATLLICAANSVGVGLDLVAVVILRDQSVSPALIGLALTGAAVGGLAGAPLVAPLHRIRPGVLLLLVCVLQVPVFLLIAVVSGPWWMAGLLFAASLGFPAIRVLIDVLILRQAEPAQRGRVVGAFTTLIGLGMPVGSAAAGLLLQFLPARIALLALAAALAVGIACCGTRRQLWQARWPQ